jgi:hypothetical protein
LTLEKLTLEKLTLEKPTWAGNGHEENALMQGFLGLADTWVLRATDARGIAWFRGAVVEVAHGAGDRALRFAIGLVPRRLGKAGLLLGAGDLAEAAALRQGFDPGDWSVDQLARIALMVASYRDQASFAESFDRFCATAEINELIALCRGLPVYPAAALIEPRAREAIRSGIKPVFEAVAHRNPYPSEVFAEDDFNQMVVKAVFIESPLWPIQGLDRRGNPKLANMLVALANERHAAGRPITSEIWRCIVPHADAEAMAALTHAWNAGAENDRLAIALASRTAPDTAAGLPFRDQLREVEARLDAAGVQWHQLA